MNPNPNLIQINFKRSESGSGSEFDLIGFNSKRSGSGSEFKFELDSRS